MPLPEIVFQNIVNPVIYRKCNWIFFFFSEAEPKGSDCFEKFMDMQSCMRDYPELYDDKDDTLNEAAEESAKEAAASKSWNQNKINYVRLFWVTFNKNLIKKSKKYLKSLQIKNVK